MKKMFRLLFGIGALGTVLSGCYPSGPDYVQDMNLVYTTYDQKTDFVSKATYSMPDKIVSDVQISLKGDTTIVYMKDIYAQPILQSIQNNMTALGWQKVAISAKPDLVLTPATFTTTTYFYSYWYNWWYGGYYGGWGWYYPPYYTVSSYTTGTLLMVMADPNLTTPTGKSPTAWLGALNGILTYTYDMATITKAIDQAFKQSPYLKTN